MNSKRVRDIARAYGLSLALWTGISLLTGWNYRIFDQGLNIQSTMLDMLLLAGSRGLAYALLTPPIFYLAHRFMGPVQNRSRYVFLYCLGVVPFMLVDSTIRWVVLPPWDPVLQRYVPRHSMGPLALIHGGFADQITIYIAIVVAAHAYEYFKKSRQQEVERYEFQRALAASELQALKTQIHPHFLFNTLHGISTLIDGDQGSAKEMVIRLSSLLRRTLEHTSADVIPLREELKFLREYLDLEQMRLGSRLAVRWSIDPNTQSILVPQLFLQPLAENAIRHGIACCRDGGWMEITSRKRENTLDIRIRNSTGGKRTAGMGVGLKNTGARLRYLYSDEATLTFAESEDHTATAMILLPALGSAPGPSAGLIPPDEASSSEESHARINRG